MGVGCLVLAISGWLLRVFAFMHAQMSALADTVPRMPQACEEMGEVSTGSSYRGPLPKQLIMFAEQ